MASPSARPLVRAEWHHASVVLGLSFQDDPMFRALLPDDDERRRALPMIMGFMLALHGAHGLALAVDDPARGVVVATPPGRHGGSWWSVVRWVLRWSRRPPIVWSARRARKNGGRVLAEMERLHPKTPHHHVAAIGVHPEAQGGGVGRRLLEGVFAHAERDGLPTYLETTNPKNLDFYRRFGFVLLQEVTCYPGAPPLWTMERPSARRAGNDSENARFP
jgi:GNAT superfamily N-acetyltransferase